MLTTIFHFLRREHVLLIGFLNFPYATHVVVDRRSNEESYSAEMIIVPLNAFRMPTIC